LQGIYIYAKRNEAKQNETARWPFDRS